MILDVISKKPDFSPFSPDREKNDETKKFPDITSYRTVSGLFY
jgi:hypothetical protein